jgi:hypothetical protein
MKKTKETIDFKARDKFVLDNARPDFQYCKEVDVRAGKYDIFCFDGMTYNDALTAVKAGWLNPKEAQNESPTVKVIMDFLKACPAFVAQGYVVAPIREDTRISFEGVIAKTPPSPKEIKAYIEMFRQADEFDMAPDYRAWYD